MSFVEIRSATEQPAYTVSDAARLLHLPVSTLRYWVKPDRGYEPIIHLDAPSYLSFRNLVEAHVLRGLRRAKRITLPRLREMLHYLQDQLAVDRPLCDERLRISGARLLFEEHGALIETSPRGQLAMRQVFQAHLERVDFEQSLAIRLYPFVWLHADPVRSGEPKVVRIDPRRSYGRPALANGVRTEMISSRFEAGEDVEDLARDYECLSSEIQEAIRYERYYQEAA